MSLLTIAVVGLAAFAELKLSLVNNTFDAIYEFVICVIIIEIPLTFITMNYILNTPIKYCTNCQRNVRTERSNVWQNILFSIIFLILGYSIKFFYTITFAMFILSSLLLPPFIVLFAGHLYKYFTPLRCPICHLTTLVEEREKKE